MSFVRRIKRGQCSFPRVIELIDKSRKNCDLCIKDSVLIDKEYQDRKTEEFKVLEIYKENKIKTQKNQLESYQKLILEFDSVFEIDSVTTIKTDFDT